MPTNHSIPGTSFIAFLTSSLRLLLDQLTPNPQISCSSLQPSTMKILLARMPAALIALASAALVGLATGMPVSGDLVPRGPVPGIQMWSGADFSGNFFHYSGPAIRFDACCTCSPVTVLPRVATDNHQMTSRAASRPVSGAVSWP